MVKLKIKKWDIVTHLASKPGSIILLLGKRGTGKSVLMQDIAKVMADNGNIDLALGMSPTDESNGALSKFLPHTLIHSEFNENVIQNIVNAQKKALKAGKPLKRVVIWLDDCGYDSAKIFKSKVMKSLFYNGRHYCIGVVMSMQFCIDVPTGFRANTDVCITLKEQIQSNRDRLWKQYFGQFETFKSFNLAMNAVTNEYGALVSANNLSQSNDICDSIFWYRARVDIPTFCLGSKIIFNIDGHCYEDREAVLEEAAQSEKRAQETIENVVPSDVNGKTIVERVRRH